MRISLLAIAFLLACDDESSPSNAASPEAEALPENVETPEAETPEAAPATDEACARAVVIAWDGAAYAPSTVTRSEEEAQARAETLLARVEAGSFIGDVARAESDAGSSGPRGGLLGTYTRESWPGAHSVLRDPVFALAVGMRTGVLRADYGYVFAERCPVEKIHTRHILIRHAGARGAPENITRSEDAARVLAEEVRAVVASAEGAGFAEVARSRSEDASAERGGDVGTVGRGLLAPEYEAAAWDLPVGGVSEVVQTAFGFHVIQRLAE